LDGRLFPAAAAAFAGFLKQFSAPPCYPIKEKMDDFVDAESETVLHRVARRTWHGFPTVVGRP
jgi:hypothetical protein